MTQIRFEKITKSFNDVAVIKELDMIIESGEFFTFVGPSGCGKSTILNMIAGLEPVTGGRIYFDSSAVNGLSPGERDVAMVFQGYALYPHMTVYENIAFPLRMKKARKEFLDSEVKRIAAFLGLEELLSRKPKELSGGQRQRVALGRAIVRRPKVFLMDEPLSNLDARLRIEMRAELKRLHRELKITTVYVTHDQAEAMSLSERIAVLHEGWIQQVGTPLDVYRKPANVFVAGFIGSPPMNFVCAAVNKRRPLEIECNGALLSPKVEALPEKDRVIVGIRPEDASICRQQSPGGIEVTIALTEPAGPFKWVDVTWDGVKVKGTSQPEEALNAGDKAFMSLSEDKVVIFDESSGLRL